MNATEELLQHPSELTVLGSESAALSCPLGDDGDEWGSGGDHKGDERDEASVLVSLGYCDKWPWTWGLKSVRIDSPTVLEATSVKSGCWQGHFPSKALGDSSFMSLLASGAYWISLACLACSCVISISAPVFTWLLPSGCLCI